MRHAGAMLLIIVAVVLFTPGLLNTLQLRSKIDCGPRGETAMKIRNASEVNCEFVVVMRPLVINPHLQAAPASRSAINGSAE